MRDQLKKLPKAATADVPKIKQKIKPQHELQFDDAKKVQQMQNKAKANYYAKVNATPKYWFNLNKPKTTIDPIMLYMIHKHTEDQYRQNGRNRITIPCRPPISTRMDSNERTSTPQY